MTKKNIFLVASIAAAAAVLLFRNISLSRWRFAGHVGSPPEEKNFGAFPPDIPEAQFENMFV